jgi:chromosome partitioning protein
MRTIAIVNEKGGTGKTTTAVNLSAALGSLGQKVLLVDLDGQAASSRWLGVEEDSRLADALLAGEGLEPLENVMPGVSLAPATGKLDSVSHDLRPSQGGQLRKVLAKVHDRYDLTIIDCPPSLGNRLIGNALLAATHALVPVETSILALDGLKILLTTLEDIREGFGHEIVLAGVLACRYDGRTRLSRLVLRELQRALPGKVFRTVIRENVRMRECPASGESILSFAPESHAAEDYKTLAVEMLSRPDAWQKPATWASEQQDQPLAEGDRCSVEDLRSSAAASVRAAAFKAGQWKPAAEAAAQAPEDGETTQAAPHVAAAGAEADDPRYANVKTCLQRLAQAEGRLLAEEEQATPVPDAEAAAPGREEDESADSVEPRPAAEPVAEPALDDERPAAVGPPAAPAEPTWTRPPSEVQAPAPAEETPPEPPEDQPAAEEEHAGPQEPSEKFPALRAFLRQMGREGDAPEPQEAGGQDDEAEAVSAASGPGASREGGG